MKTHAAVILAAGKGTRMKSQTPKVLHRICGREMLSLVVSTAQQLSLSPIVVVVPKDSQPIQNALGDSIGYAVQEEQLGTGHALLQAQPSLNGVDNVLVLYGDVPLIREETLQHMMQLHEPGWVVVMGVSGKASGSETVPGNSSMAAITSSAVW